MTRRTRRLQATSITLALLMNGLPQVFGCKTPVPQLSSVHVSSWSAESSSAAPVEVRPRRLCPGESAGTRVRLVSTPVEDSEPLRRLPVLVLTSLAVSSLPQLADFDESSSVSAISWLSQRSPLERRLLDGLVSAAVAWGVGRVGRRTDTAPGAGSECPGGEGRIETLCV